jgi:hypothetical protein
MKTQFLKLYEKCIAAGLHARVTIQHLGGSQEVSIFCHHFALAVTAVASGSAAAINAAWPLLPPRPQAPPICTQAPPMASPLLPCLPLQSQPILSPLPLAPTPALPDPATAPSPFSSKPPPAKRTRNAAKQQSARKLLRDDGEKTDLYPSPVMSSLPLSSGSPSPSTLPARLAPTPPASLPLASPRASSTPEQPPIRPPSPPF